MSDQYAKNEQKRALLKNSKKEILLSYLADPGNEVLPRCRLATDVLGYKKHGGMYRLFSSHELDQIEVEALEIRRSRFAPQLGVIDKALLKKAQGGNVAAAKLCYQKFEGWKPEERKKVDIVSNMNVQTLKILLEELLEDVHKANQHPDNIISGGESTIIQEDGA